MTRRPPHEMTRSVGWVRVRHAGRLVWQAHPQAVVVSVVAAVVAGLGPVAAALLLRDVVDVIAGGGTLARAIAPGLGLVLVALVSAGLPYVTDYFGGQLRRRLQEVTADQLFAAIADWPGLSRFENPEYYDRLRMGQRAGESASGSLVAGGLIAVQSLVSLIGFLVTLVVISPAIALLVFLATLPAIPVNLALSREHADMQWWNSPGARRVQFFSSLLSDIDAAKEIRLFGTARFLRKRMLTDLAAVNESERRVEVRSLRRNLILALVGAVVGAASIVWAISMAVNGQISVGDLTALIAALSGTELAMGSAIIQYAQLHQFLLTFGHYLEVTEAPSDLAIADEPIEPPALWSGVRFENVWFRYDPELPWVLRGVDVTLRAGESTGLVGLNGAGKSTFVKLLCRFYDPQRGRITWDGIDIRAFDPERLRERVTALFQDFVAYELTAAENIGLGDLSALTDRERLHTAARAAGMDDFLRSLPAGMDTLLSRVLVADGDPEDPEIGTTLSGGQWQRLALARAAVRSGRDLMILDEPTSGLDPRAEQEVVAELRRQRAGATSLIISHRMGTIRELDHIVVLDDGVVVESGTHEELLDAAGAYAELFTIQAHDYRARPGDRADHDPAP